MIERQVHSFFQPPCTQGETKHLGRIGVKVAFEKTIFYWYRTSTNFLLFLKNPRWDFNANETNCLNVTIDHLMESIKIVPFWQNFDQKLAQLCRAFCSCFIHFLVTIPNLPRGHFDHKELIKQIVDPVRAILSLATPFHFDRNELAWSFWGLALSFLHGLKLGPAPSEPCLIGASQAFKTTNVKGQIKFDT